MQLRYPEAKHDVSGKMHTIGEYPRGYLQGAVVHFTAGSPAAVSTVEGGIRNKYAFLTISPEGQVYQNFDLNRWGSHAGKSSHQKLGESVSRFLVGIEVCNAGKVRQIDDKTFRPWFNDPEHYRQRNEPIPAGVPNPKRDLPKDQVRYVERLQNRQAGWFHAYTKQQEAALTELLLWLKTNAPDIFDLEFVLGHDEVSLGRKNDPGGALSMNMPDYRAHLKALYSFLRDTAFNRGNVGAVKIIQIALNVTADGKIGPITLGQLTAREAVSPVELLQALRTARETYERNFVGYRANLWTGLENRWNKAHAFALELIKGAEAKAAAAEVQLALSAEASLIGPEDGTQPASLSAVSLVPPLCYAPAHFSMVAQRFQEFANEAAGLKLEEDGMAGDSTSDAFRLLTGYYLAHDPRVV